ncbi:MAG: primosomal protein N' [Bacteroidales bacterium]|nr:primosomal protein N' [Bacteroidales bacterium]
MADSSYIHVLLPLKLKWEPVYSVPSCSIAVGDRVRVEFAGKEYVGVVTDSDASEDAAGIGPDRIKPVLEILTRLNRISKEELELWRQVSEYYLCTAGEVYKAAYPMGKIEEEQVKARLEERHKARIERLEDKIAKARREDTRARYVEQLNALMSRRQAPGPGGAAGETSGPQGPELSPAQTEAYSRIKDIFGNGRPALLHGVTGSGKTEVYMKLAREALDNGRNVLFLVPEIALSRQLEERTRAVFPEELQVFHSAETVPRRIETSIFMRSNPYLILGTRSSVFLPHRDLGLVIVDEEQDPSYKQDNPSPRYNGREAAIMLAGIFRASVILGSATPSLESLYNCSAGRFAKVDLTRRFFDAADADVEIIDTIAERKKNGMVGSFSRKLIEHIGGTLEAGGQTAILRERRSYSPVVQCQECGSILKCDRCDVALSLHHRPDGSEKLVCHYCGRVREYTGRCPKCGGNLQPLGAGTQKIEEEARKLFPEARIARLDSDNHSAEAGIIKQFETGQIDILIGTRMVAKGFDFSGLSLVAVLQADSLLGQQDFRADEHALQLLEQFRGRCGRRAEKGLFVIQTSQPDHPVYSSVLGASQDSAGFLKERKLFGYPPYSRVINIILRDYNLQRLELMSRFLSEALSRSGLSEGSSMAGPYPPAVEKVAREHIRILRVLLPKDRNLKSNKRIVLETLERFEKDRKYPGHISLDVDPV